MLQRIQTVFFVLVIVLGVIFSFVPVLEFTQGDGNFLMGAYKTINVSTGVVVSKNMGIGVLQGLVILVSLVIIFQFKNRSLQMKLGKLNVLFLALQIAAMVMYSDSAKTNINVTTDDVATAIKFGAVIPLVSLILTYLGIRFIKKDDDLVRSADRLR